MNILQLIITHILTPKDGNHTKVINTNALLMYKIMNRQPFNLLDLMLWNMTHLSKKILLPYDIYLDLSREESVALQDVHIYLRGSARHMHYVQAHTYYTCHRQITDHYIYLYSVTTLTEFLLEGNARPLGILPEAVESSTYKESEQVPPTTNDLVIDIDASPAYRHTDKAYLMVTLMHICKRSLL